MNKRLERSGTIVRQDSPDDAGFRSPEKRGLDETLVRSDSPDDVPTKVGRRASGKPV
ncbi:MAG: hypothetical protein Q8P50_10420 [Bacillota bacterium]|nr:hypothetical protein [Bacillota bacterium]